MGPTAHRFLRQLSDKCSVVALAETHVAEEGIPRWREVLRADGFRLAATPGFSTGRSEQGVHGGEWVLSRLSVAATTFEGQRQYWSTCGDTPFYGFCSDLQYAISLITAPSLRTLYMDGPWMRVFFWRHSNTSA